MLCCEKVKLCLSLITHYARKTDGGMEIEVLTPIVLPPRPTVYKTSWAPQCGRRGGGKLWPLPGIEFRIICCSIPNLVAPGNLRAVLATRLASHKSCDTVYRTILLSRAVQSVHKSSDSDSSIFKTPTPSQNLNMH
jgi:hypothetical protein